ncbi:MAG TPA: FdhF/YdeP family oxidoreductase [Candidatus Didemnitutus sp.]|nr:FdhF/YdeP family oxidoreductase [Candidatus Didemnitutus sp.]
MSDLPSAQPPVELEGTRLGQASAAAGGLTAVQKSLGIGIEEMGWTRTAKTLLRLNQKTGFDCQSCAWPSPDDSRHVAEFCENGAKAVADEATLKKITPEFFRRFGVAELAAQSDHWLGHQGRLTEPMVLRPGASHYEPISWNDAFALIATELKALPSPNAASFYTSGRTSNEAAFLYQLFVRAFGTNNLPDCSNMCHESSGSALGPVLGIGKGCVTLADFEKADAIFVVGQNPGTNHPRMLTSLQAAKRRGCRIVSINPLPEVGLQHFKNPQDLKNPLRIPELIFGKGTAMADLWLPVRINGDMAVFQGVMKELLAEEEKNPGRIFDRSFIEQYTHGYPELIAHLRATSWDDILAVSGLNREQIHAAAEIAKSAKAIIVCWAMGLTQHKEAVATIQEILNFLLLGGHIGRPGAGPCPVRGHSNVQGDRTMGIFEKPTAAFLDQLAAEFAFSPPREHGLDVVDTIKAMHAGDVRVFFGMGGNFLSATPDTELTAAALRRCTLTAQVATKLNRSHLITGRTALILPCLGRSETDVQQSGEQFVTVEDSMGIISSSRGTLPPASEHLLSEPAIVAGLAAATLGPRTPVDWARLAGNYDLIRDHIERVVPGFDRYNERVKQGPFYLPNGPRDERKFNTATRRANFTVHALPSNSVPVGQLIMMTIRSHDQFNTTIYGLDDRYRGIFNGRRVIFMNGQDVADRGLVQGQLVDLASHFNGVERVARSFMVAPYDIPRGCTATYFPETNVLVPIDSVAEVSNTPTSKFVLITVSPVANPAEALANLQKERATVPA